jgi:hypothetical protein
MHSEYGTIWSTPERPTDNSSVSAAIGRLLTNIIPPDDRMRLRREVNSAARAIPRRKIRAPDPDAPASPDILTAVTLSSGGKGPSFAMQWPAAMAHETIAQLMDLHRTWMPAAPEAECGVSAVDMRALYALSLGQRLMGGELQITLGELSWELTCAAILIVGQEELRTRVAWAGPDHALLLWSMFMLDNDNPGIQSLFCAVPLAWLARPLAPERQP